MADLNQDEQARRELLQNARVIAVVGMSNDHYYTSYEIGTYLREQGYLIYPVNPTIEEVDGHRSYPTLADVPAPIDIVDVFRDPAFFGDIVDESITVGAKAVWGQTGIFDLDARNRAVEAGLDVVMDLCIRDEHKRFFGK